MHPDLFMIWYRQQERELERRLRHRLAAEERESFQTVMSPRRFAPLLRLASRLRERIRLAAAPDPTCCVAT